MVGRGNSMCKDTETRDKKGQDELGEVLVCMTRAQVCRSGGIEGPGREARLDPPGSRGLPRHQNLTLALTGR